MTRNARRTWKAWLGVVLLSACSPALPSVDTTSPTDPRFAQALSSLQHHMAEGHVPGAAIAVVVDGKLAFSAGAGVKRAGEADPVDDATLFRVASLSKMVLAATAMKMVEAGSLDVAQAVTKYVPLSAGTDAITVEELLTHTSGLSDFATSEASCPVGVGQLAAQLSTPQTLLTAPAQVWDYTNRGYSVAGWVLETISGQRYEDLATQLVLGPSGMTTATFDPSVAMNGDHAFAHHRHDGANIIKPLTAFDCATSRPPAGIMASVLDYAHFAEMLLADGGAVLSSASVAQMSSGHVDTDEYPDHNDSYGYGLHVHTGDRGVTIVRHDGSAYGFRSELWMVPAQKLAVVVFYNSDAANPADVAQDAVDIFAGLDEPAPNWKTPSSSWAQDAGTYVDPVVLGTITVTLDDGELYATSGAKRVRLTQVAGDRFSTSDGDVTFYPSATEPAHWFVTRQGVGVRQ